MTKDEILAASDEQLNEWCATKVMGWVLHHRNLKGLAHYRYEDGIFVEMACNYTPTTDIAQAIGLLDHLHATKTLDDWGITRFPRYYICSITCPHPSIPKQILAINHAHKEMCRAIVFACLLTVAELEQQTAAGDAAREGAG